MAESTALPPAGGLCAIRLSVEPNAGGTWRLSLADRTGTPIAGRVGAAWVAAVRQAAAVLEAAVPPVPLPGHEQEVSQAEEGMGRAMAAAIADCSPVALRLAYTRGWADRGGDVLVLAVHSDDPEVRALPWELLARGPSAELLEATGRGLVVRLVCAEPAPLAVTARGLQVIRWCPDPTDSIVRTQSGALDRLVQGLGLGSVVDLPPSPRVLPDQAPDTAEVLHVICHGREHVNQVLVALGTGGGTAGELAHLLSPLLRRVCLVVLDVCKGGLMTDLELDAPASRLVAAGAPAVVAPRATSAAHAGVTFAQGLYGALARGATVPVAVREGRRHLRALKEPHPDARWRSVVLSVGSLESAVAPPPVAASRRPRGFPQPHPDAAPWLQAAMRQADRWALGHVGMLDLCEALLEVPATGPVRRLRAATCGLVEHYSQIAEGLVTEGELPLDPTPTPRLRRLAERLAPGFSVLDLFAELGNDNEDSLGRLYALDFRRKGPSRQTTTVGISTATLSLAQRYQAQRQPAQRLVVIGGPEDGKVLEPRVGHGIGRWSPLGSEAVPDGLYDGTFAADISASRFHLLWGPGGQHQAQRTLVHYSDNQATTVRSGEHLSLLVGDRVLLGKCTWLLGVD